MVPVSGPQTLSVSSVDGVAAADTMAIHELRREVTYSDSDFGCNRTAAGCSNHVNLVAAEIGNLVLMAAKGLPNPLRLHSREIV